MVGMEPIPIWRAKLESGRLHLQPNPELARRRIVGLQQAALQAVGEGAVVEADCPLTHSFIDGAYVRTIFIPAGTVIVGKIHKHSHANILSQGHVLVYTEQGGLEELHGPRTMVSPAGCKRAVYAFTDVVWTTIHVTDATDLDEIEDYVIAKDYAEYHEFAQAIAQEKQRCLQ